MRLAQGIAGGRAKSQFVVMDVKRKSLSSLTGATAHENRTGGDLTHVDSERTQLNQRVAYNGHHDSPAKAVADYIKDKNIKIDARNTTPITSFVLSATPEYFDMKGKEPNKKKLDAWTNASMKWVLDEFGSDAVHASLHVDEKTPHIHVHIVPTYEKTTKHKTVLQASHHKHPAFRGKMSFKKVLDRYSERMEPLGIHRGEKVPEGARGTHKTARQWVNEMARRLSGQSQQIAILDEREKQVSKREKALDVKEASLMSETVEMNTYRDELVAYASGLETKEVAIEKAAETVQALQQVRQITKVEVAKKPEKRTRRRQSLKGRASDER